MENSDRSKGIADITLEAYDASRDSNKRSPCRVKKRTFVITVICALLLILIFYWFVNSILENHHENFSNENETGIVKLQHDVIPLEYSLKIIPILEEGNFTTIGEVQIQLYCKTQTNHFRLHSRNLEILELTLSEFQAVNKTRLNSEYSQKINDFIDVYLDEWLFSGRNYILKIKFNGHLSNSEGLFKTSYVDKETNKTTWIAMSDFVPDYARSAFPCFDEPWIKTHFRISIGRRFDMISHSNSLHKIVHDIIDMPGYKWDHYKRTSLMPTFGVAIMVTNFANYSLTATDGTLYSVYSVKPVGEEARRIILYLSSLVNLMQNLTDFNYDLDKFDIIITPETTKSHYINGFGISVFNEKNIIPNKNGNMLKHRKKIVSSLSNRVASQWFRYLVTPNDWTNFWIMQGLTAIYSRLIANYVEPAIKPDENFHFTHHIALRLDSTSKSHALHRDLSAIERLEEVMDQISSFKGTAILHTLYEILGENVFHSAIRRYIQAFGNRGVGEEDLWDVFQNEMNFYYLLPENVTLHEVMNSWTQQAGFPIVLITRNVETGSITVTQNRFHNNGLNESSHEKWHVLLTWVTDTDRAPTKETEQMWLNDRRMEISNEKIKRTIDENRFILFNLHNGFYRVNYDEDNWELLINSYSSFPKFTRSQLINDATAIANAGMLSQTVPLRLLQKMYTETEQIVWDVVLDSWHVISNRLIDVKSYSFFWCKILSNVYSQTARTLTYRDPNEWTYFETLLTILACSFGHKSCITHARSLAHKSMVNSSIEWPNNIHSISYCFFIHHASEEQLRVIHDKYENVKGREKTNLIGGLTCLKNTTTYRRYVIDFLTQPHTDNELKEQLFFMFNFNVYKHHNIFDIVKNYWKTILEMDDSSKSLSQIIAYSMNYNYAPNDLEELKNLKKQISMESNIEIEKAFDCAENKLRENIEWSQKYRQEMVEFFDTYAQEQVETRDCQMEK